MLLSLERACHKTKHEQNSEPKNSFALRLNNTLLGKAVSTGSQSTSSERNPLERGQGCHTSQRGTK